MVKIIKVDGLFLVTIDKRIDSEWDSYTEAFSRLKIIAQI